MLQWKDFFSSELQSEIAANLGKVLLLQTSTNVLHPSPEAPGFVGPVQLLESDLDAEKSNVDPKRDDNDDPETVAEAASSAEESNSESINQSLSITMGARSSAKNNKTNSN
jgi:hypothetical protein